MIRHSKGRLITRKAQKFPCSSGVLVEALVLVRQGLHLASSGLCRSILLESDNLEVIEACRLKSARSELVSVVEDIANMRAWFFDCVLLWTPREAKKVAHHEARLLLDANLHEDWMVRYPVIIDQKLKKDSSLL